MFFNIQRWSLHDGPGIRTTVFFKGCPLRCRWCSNPESWDFDRQLLFQRDKCIGCQNCISVCPANANLFNDGNILFLRDQCICCGNCVDICPENAREIIGQDMPADRIIKLLEQDAVFYRSSGGGVTFSGGEPFARLKTLQQLAKGCSMAGIHTTVETSGYFSLTDAHDVLPWIDDIFIDLKHTNSDIHETLTGVPNHRIIKNIVRLDESGRKLTIRIPLVKDLTDTTENINGVIKLCLGLKNLIGIELMIYHNLGAGKYAGLDMPYDSSMAAPGQKTIEAIQNRLKNHGLSGAVLAIQLN